MKQLWQRDALAEEFCIYLWRWNGGGNEYLIECVLGEYTVVVNHWRDGRHYYRTFLGEYFTFGEAQQAAYNHYNENHP